jgi:inosose dehydratase
MNRRKFLSATALATASASVCSIGDVTGTPDPIVATNVYPWMTFYRRDSLDWNTRLQHGLDEIAACGFHGFEPIGESPEQIRTLIQALKPRGLSLDSVYVNSTLHDPEVAPQSIDKALEIAAAAAEFGTSILVTNPSPIRWGGTENKDDSQLRIQARALETLGRQLGDLGVRLAYHNHDAELRAGAREFHHMLTATDPQYVGFCLDSHWVYRGCGNSEVALFDIIDHYHSRIVELHLRQSRNGIWSEVFSMDGDIDYQKLFLVLERNDRKPHLVMEQAIEEKSPHTLPAREAHTAGLKNLKKAAIPG